jgi:hypothetical protein
MAKIPCSQRRVILSSRTLLPAQSHLRPIEVLGFHCAAGGTVRLPYSFPLRGPRLRTGSMRNVCLHRLASNAVDDRSPLGGRRLYIDRIRRRIAVRMFGIVLILRTGR